MRWRRAILFRTLALLLAFTPFLLAEGILRFLDLGRPSFHCDPYIGFAKVNPLFELNSAAQRYELAPSRQKHFVACSFPARKSNKEYRIFCLGDSTVQGNPWSVETSFTAWLQLTLQSADPSRDWNVINCGGVSYASYRMVPILEELVRYQPDLVIVHCSHNEFLEDRSYESLKRAPAIVLQLHAQLSQLRISEFLRSIGRSFAKNAGCLPGTGVAMAVEDRKKRPLLTAEVEALLDYRGGIEFYHHNAKWHQGVIDHYEYNLRRMAAIAKQHQIPLILMNPACNLRDSPPFKAEHRVGITPPERERWNALWSQARVEYWRDPRRAVRILQDAMEIDDQHAGMHYDLAKCYDSLKQFSSARAEYALAKDKDVCPLRILESMNDVVLSVAEDTDATVVDVKALFDRLSRNGIPGSDWFVDHVHPTILGYQRIADELAYKMIRMGIVIPQERWLEQKKEAHDRHFQSLPTVYFLRGQERLRALMMWANGRATREPSQEVKLPTSLSTSWRSVPNASDRW